MAGRGGVGEDRVEFDELTALLSSEQAPPRSYCTWRLGKTKNIGITEELPCHDCVGGHEAGQGREGSGSTGRDNGCAWTWTSDGVPRQDMLRFFTQLICVWSVLALGVTRFHWDGPPSKVVSVPRSAIARSSQYRHVPQPPQQTR